MQSHLATETLQPLGLSWFYQETLAWLHAPCLPLATAACHTWGFMTTFS